MLLTVKNLDCYYGQSQALKEINIEVDEGECICILGANGSGKSTLLKTITGLVKPRRGEIWFAGKRIDEMPAYAIVREGITLCPEDKKIFPQMSVYKNLYLGAWVHGGKEEKIRANLGYVFELFPILKERQHQDAGTLSGGEQQMLVIGRSLMSNPRLLMLDEPSLGLAPMVVNSIFEVIREINARKTTVLIVEQNASMALKIAKRGYVIETGKITIAGTAEEMLKNEKVKKAYLGV
jgi:branched-chain amino acid transport system ATP-binding protein